MPFMTDDERKKLVDAAWQRYKEEARKISLDLSWHDYLEEDERIFEKFKAEEASILRQK